FDISSIFISQSTGVKELAIVKAVLRGMKNELGSMKELVSNLSDLGHQGPSEEAVRPSGPVGVEESGPPGPSEEAVRLPGPSVDESGSPGQVMEESGLAGPVEPEAEQVRVEDPVEATVVPPEPPVPSPLQTPAPPSPPSSSTAPLAPATFKQPLPKHISSPAPFSTISSSPTSSTFIPPPIFENPPASSSAGSLSAGPSSARPSVPPPPTSYSTLHPPTPPSFITLILEGAQIPGVVIEYIKDEFEEAILRLVFSLSSHVHRIDSSSPAPKKRKVSKDLALSSEPPRVSSIPIVDDTDSLLDIYARSDITSLAKDRAYAQIRLDEISIHQALQLGQDASSPCGFFNGQRCHMCVRSDPLQKVMERLANPGVRRVVIVEAGSKRVEGIISLSDVFRFLLG
ncbi:hypothetical protein Taro_019078, partial [Colocasia esculenta]|nr:hypothetical protein [Colocasia esculenta]